MNKCLTTPQHTQKLQIAYWVSNKWYLNRKLNGKYYMDTLKIHMVITQTKCRRKHKVLLLNILDEKA